jgi:hypothetical protein
MVRMSISCLQPSPVLRSKASRRALTRRFLDQLRARYGKLQNLMEKLQIVFLSGAKDSQRSSLGSALDCRGVVPTI